MCTSQHAYRAQSREPVPWKVKVTGLDSSAMLFRKAGKFFQALGEFDTLRSRLNQDVQSILPITSTISNSFIIGFAVFDKSTTGVLVLVVASCIAVGAQLPQQAELLIVRRSLSFDLFFYAVHSI